MEALTNMYAAVGPTESINVGIEGHFFYFLTAIGEFRVDAEDFFKLKARHKMDDPIQLVERLELEGYTGFIKRTIWSGALADLSPEFIEISIITIEADISYATQEMQRYEKQINEFHVKADAQRLRLANSYQILKTLKEMGLSLDYADTTSQPS